MKKITIFLFIVLIVLIYVPLIFSTNRAANDFPLAQPDVVTQGFSFPQSWSTRGNGLGENIIFTLGSYPIDFLFGLGSKIGISFDVLTKIIFIIPTLIFGVFSMKKLLSLLKIEGTDQIPGILLFLTNTYILLLIDGGQLSIALAVSWLPAVYCYFDEALKGSWQTKLRAALAFCLLAILDLRIAYVLLLLIFIQYIFELLLDIKRGFKTTLGYFVSGLTIGIVWVALNLYWLIPFVKSGVQSIPGGLINVNQLTFLNFTNIVNGLFLQQPHWPLNSFGQLSVPDWKFVFLFIPVIFVFMKQSLKRKELFFLIIFLVGVFLVKGSNPPFGNGYSWLFQHIPGFFLFRDSTKFFALITTAFSVLVSVGFVSLKKKSVTLGKYAQLTFILYIFVLVSPILLKKMTGFFTPQIYSNDFNSVSQTISEDSSFGRILWMPSRPPLGYASLTHPALDGLTIASTRPYSIANVGSYERFNFLREPKYSKQLLDILGISYVAYPYYDTRKQQLAPDEIAYYHTFVDQLTAEKWVSQVIHSDPVTVFKTTATPTMFSTSDRLWWVVGSDTLYDKLYNVPGFKTLDNPLIFTDAQPGLLQKFEQYQFGKVLVFNKTDDDILANFVPQNNIKTPKDMLESSEGSSFWNVDINTPSTWREFLQEKYNLDAVDMGPVNPAAVFEGGGQFTLLNPSHANTILVRALVGPKGGLLTINDSQEIVTKVPHLGTILWGITVDPKNPPKEYDNAEFHWFVIKNADLKPNIKLSFTGDLNAISEIAYTDDNFIAEKRADITTLKKEGQIIDLAHISETQKSDLFGPRKSETSIVATNSDFTHYQVTLSGNSSKTFILFSQTYDPKWIMENEVSLPTFGLLNGFIVSNQTHNLNYQPQQYFSKELDILELIIAVGIIFISGIRFKKNEA